MIVEIEIGQYKDEIEKTLNVWMEENEYAPVKLEGEVLKDLLDEFLCFLTSESDMAMVMDEIDNCLMLDEYVWCTRTSKEED